MIFFRPDIFSYVGSWNGIKNSYIPDNAFIYALIKTYLLINNTTIHERRFYGIFQVWCDNLQTRPDNLQARIQYGNDPRGARFDIPDFY